jgi:ribosomal protein S12 methylthiotransferase accessory factor
MGIIKKNHPLSSVVLKIVPWVLYRPTPFPFSPNSYKYGIVLRNLKDDAHFEFRNPEACLWLFIDGSRTVAEVIEKSFVLLKVKNPRYLISAYHFFEDLLEMELVTEKSFGKNRSSAPADSKEFFGKLNLGPFPITRKKVVLKRVDRQTLLEVNQKFSKVFKSKIKILIKRSPLSFASIPLHFFMADLQWKNYEVASGYGISFSQVGAATSAVGEAVERLCIDAENMVDVNANSYNNLKNSGQDVLDPESYTRYDSAQSAVVSGEVINLKKNIKAHWGIFEDCSTANRILIPVELARGKEFFLPTLGEKTSNGCAAHSDPFQAKINGALELIERDHVLFYWRTGNTPREIDQATLPDHIRQIMSKLGGLEKGIKFFYLKMELSPITIQAVFLGRSTKEPHFLLAAATRLNPVDCVEKALLELLSILQGYRPDQKVKATYGNCLENSVWDFQDRFSLYAHSANKEAYRFLISEKPKFMSFQELLNQEAGDPIKNFQAIVENLKSHKIRLYFRDATLPKFKSAGLFVYRAFSPDLIALDCLHRFRGLGHDRYYKMPSQLRLKKKPLKARDLNPWPHPIC